MVLAASLGAGSAGAIVGTSSARSRYDTHGPIPAVLNRIDLESSATCERYMWQGVLHERNRATGFRGCDDPDPHEVVAIGDSFTWGVGVRASEAWPALIGSANAGIAGANADDELRMLRDAYDRRPAWISHAHTIVLGVCLNDAMSGGPKPGWYGWRARANSVGLLRRAGLGITFAVENRTAWEHREDMVRLAWEQTAWLVRKLGARPVAITLMTPETGDEQLSRKYERGLRDAGWQVVPHPEVPTPGVVSVWEAHPNAEAHRRFAEAIRGAL